MVWLPIVTSWFKKYIFIPIFVMVGLLFNDGMLLSTTSTSISNTCSQIKTGIFTCFKLWLSTLSPNLNKELLSISLLFIKFCYFASRHSTNWSSQDVPATVLVHALSKIPLRSVSATISFWWLFVFLVKSVTCTVKLLSSTFRCGHAEAKYLIDSQLWNRMTLPLLSIEFERFNEDEDWVFLPLRNVLPLPRPVLRLKPLLRPLSVYKQSSVFTGIQSITSPVSLNTFWIFLAYPCTLT